MEEKRILIIGAGLSGLVAAIHCEKAGLHPILLEATDRVGGRVKTDQESGALLDHGFQVLLTAYAEAQRYLDFSKLDLQYFASGALIFNGQKKIRIADPLRTPSRLLDMVFSSVGTIKDKYLVFRLSQELKKSSAAAIFDQQIGSTRSFLKEYGFSEGMIERFFRPFFGGIFLENALQTPASMFKFVFKMFAEGKAAIPAEGMAAIPDQLFAQLQNTKIHFNTKVEKIENHEVCTSDGQRMPFDKLIIAGNPYTLLPNLKGQSLDYYGTSNLYYVAETSPLQENIIALVSNSESLINNFCVLTDVSSTYLEGPGHLVSVTLKDIPGPEERADFYQLIAEEIKQICQISGAMRMIKRFDIHHALPINEMLAYSLPNTQFSLTDDIFLAGDHLLNASIDASMRSGRLAAEALIHRL